MSTTTVGDLLEAAKALTVALRTTDADITLDQWRSFDATVHRLLHELAGPERTGARDTVLSHAPLSRVANTYPRPLAAPSPDATYTARQAASHLGLSPTAVVADIRASRLAASSDGRRYRIKANDLPTVTDTRPADPASTHPMDRLSCTLGALADLVVAEGSRPTAVPDLDPLRDDAQVAPVMARVLALTVAAARHAMGHLPLHDSDRPLTIARYAEHCLDALGDPDRPSNLTQVASFAPPIAPRGPNEELEAALRAWARSARTELARTVPSTEVLRNIANQGRHLYAVTARLVETSSTTGPRHGLTDTATQSESDEAIQRELREAAQVMHRLQQHWKPVTTATGPTHEYVTATTTLHTVLSAVERERGTHRAVDGSVAQLNVPQALSDLRYAAAHLAELSSTAAQLPEPLIRSGVLFAPARILTSTVERLPDRRHGRYVAITVGEGAALLDAAHQGASAARQVNAILAPDLRRVWAAHATLPPVGRAPQRDLQPLTRLEGPVLL